MRPLRPNNANFETSTLRIYVPETEIDTVDPGVDVTM